MANLPFRCPLAERQLKQPEQGHLHCKRREGKPPFGCAQTQLERHSTLEACESLKAEQPASVGSACVQCVSLLVVRLLLAFALLASWATPARAISLSARTDRLIDRLEQLGVVIDRLERCGPGAERAAYNMGCLLYTSPSPRD